MKENFTICGCILKASRLVCRLTMMIVLTGGLCTQIQAPYIQYSSGTLQIIIGHLQRTTQIKNKDIK
uniref:Uncharacterized protein n=1 Tax=Rhizophora mucronata TaxID=61149 RepID=A0A2P2JSS7_RHIMU